MKIQLKYYSIMSIFCHSGSSGHGRAEEFVQRKEVFAIATHRAMLHYQLDMHPLDQDVEMVGDDSDLGNEETDESKDSNDGMNKD
ncbi:uncharacterized protein ARMOST_15211 [Armillaria ostoyae]|uniref:Uncharacterized protein n=1 Tax=Armillaria ostoyae TaxID=47428 RepID=A0A284RSR0_ARMOS|nr:uncharacterized protein ARMOST_15211 [Armillaria ostoyae]